MSDLSRTKYSPRVMAQPCSRCGTPAYGRCKSPRGEDTHAHQDRLIAAGYVYDPVTKTWA